MALTTDVDVDGHVVRAGRLELELLDGEVLVVLGVYRDQLLTAPAFSVAHLPEIPYPLAVVGADMVICVLGKEG